VQSDEDADRAKKLGADPAKVLVTGNLSSRVEIIPLLIP
jgi:3-deoxy-D-manno-octulosonic-acid transferase